MERGAEGGREGGMESEKEGGREGGREGGYLAYKKHPSSTVFKVRGQKCWSWNCFSHTTPDAVRLVYRGTSPIGKCPPP